LSRVIKVENSKIPHAIAKTEKLIRMTEEKLQLLQALKASLLNMRANYPVPERRQTRQLSLPFVS
jgi:hypothetical protein